jgi:hypothetical protein
MKTIHRKRITIREKETVVVKTAASPDVPHFCPFCNAPIDPARAPANCMNEATVTGKKMLSETTENKE